MANTYYYYINLDERGEFYSDVRDENGNTIAEFYNAVEFYEDGFGNLRDVADVTDYLASVGVIGPVDAILWGE